jgi:hypothetical protein
MRRFVLAAIVGSVVLSISTYAQQAGVGPNINIVGGPAKFDPTTKIPIMGDPYLNRQNEPSGACSSRNPLNCIVGTNDYRAVNVPGLPDGKVTGDAALGVYWTRDGGLTWRSWLLPGYRQDQSPEGIASPAHPYEAMADPTVRGGTNGLFYYTGIAFNRSAVGSNSAGTEGKDGVLFSALYIDDNNTQQVDTPFRHVRQSAIAYSNGARFLDKPTMAVDIPRQGSAICTIPASADGKIPAQSFPGGNVYVAYSAFMGPTDHEHTKIMFVRSTDCGKTWGGSVKLSESFKINQSAAIAITPAGQVQVAWREFNSTAGADQIVVATSDDLGQSFKKGVVASALSSAGASTAFDQPSLPAAAAPGYRMFRTNSYPAICAASNGKTYLLWSERIDPSVDRLSRIMYASSADGVSWSTPSPVDGASAPGHQFMPAVSCAGNKVTALWYDQRDDAALPITLPVFGVGAFIADLLALTIPARTLDVRSAQLTTDAAAPLAFAPSVKVSRYPVGIFNVGDKLLPLQLQYNLENLPLFGGGKIPFIGDYIDIIPATTFLPVSMNGGQSGVTPSGTTQKNNSRATRNAQAALPNGWEFNTTPAGTPVFHAFWTDNRNVVAGGGLAVDPFASPTCSPGTQSGSKNQDVYTARLSRGLAAGVFGNARTQRIDPATTPTSFPPLTQRAYAVYVQNLSGTEKLVNLTIATEVTAPEKVSFRQFAAAPLTTLQAKIAPYSGIARTVYVTTTAVKSIRVDVDEVVVAPAIADSTFVMINPDPTNPAPIDTAVANFNETHGVTLGTPDIGNIRLADLASLDSLKGAIDPLNPNFLNPNFLNPNFLNPNFLNPNFLNPNFLNPNFLNPNFLNPNFLNPNFLNPNFLNQGFENPNFLNPNFLNPNFLNPNFLNGAPDPTLTTMTWETEAAANTGSSYLFRALTTQPLPEAWLVQVLIYRLYFAPGPTGNGGPGTDACGLTPTVHHELISSVLNPTTLNPANLNLDASNPNFLNSAENPEVANTSFALSAGDKALITLQILTPDGALTVEEAREMISAIVIPEAVNSTTAAAGGTTPAIPVTITTATIPRVTRGVAYDTTLTAAGGVAPYTWSLTSGAVPPGLALTAAGQLLGTATAAGSYPVVIKVTDAATPAQTSSRSFTIRVLNPQLLNGDFENGLADWTLLSNDVELQQGVFAATEQFTPPLQGNAYRIRPGDQSPGAGLSQTIVATPGQPYSWSVTVAAREFQNPGEADPLGTFELLLNGTVVATVTYNDADPHSQTFSGTYTPSTDQIEFKMVFNRGSNSFTDHPQWFVDDAFIGLPALIFVAPDPSGGDFIDRGFYIRNYPGTSLSSVTLWMTGAVANTYTLNMTVRSGAYNGALIGSSNQTVALPALGNALVPVTFFFPSSPAVAQGSLVTFAMTQTNPVKEGTPDVYYNVPETGACTANFPIVQTNGTAPPLDTCRRDGVSIRLTGGGGGGQ